jgi:hypothetical protein
MDIGVAGWMAALPGWRPRQVLRTDLRSRSIVLCVAFAISPIGIDLVDRPQNYAGDDGWEFRTAASTR